MRLSPAWAKSKTLTPKVKNSVEIVGLRDGSTFRGLERPGVFTTVELAFWRLYFCSCLDRASPWLAWDFLCRQEGSSCLRFLELQVCFLTLASGVSSCDSHSSGTWRTPRCCLHLGKPEESLSSLFKTTHLVSPVEKPLHSQLQGEPLSQPTSLFIETVALCASWSLL